MDPAEAAAGLAPISPWTVPVPQDADRVLSALRRRLAPSAGLVLLLAGGALLVRVTVMAIAGDGGRHAWLAAAAACVLAGVALVLVALPEIAPSRGEADEPSPELPRG